MRSARGFPRSRSKSPGECRDEPLRAGRSQYEYFKRSNQDDYDRNDVSSSGYYDDEACPNPAFLGETDKASAGVTDRVYALASEDEGESYSEMEKHELPRPIPRLYREPTTVGGPDTPIGSYERLRPSPLAVAEFRSSESASPNVRAKFDQFAHEDAHQHFNDFTYDAAFETKNLHSFGESYLNVSHAGGTLPPPSPLLEPYRGTYQTISPMPSPSLSARSQFLPAIPPLSPALKPVKRVSFYNPAAHVKALSRALTSLSPSSNTLLNILPSLSSHDVIDLRDAYKDAVKLHGRGINLAKHIKLAFPPTTSPFGLAAYTVALGKWESEAHWLKVSYHSARLRQELIIESVFGRTNADVRDIKAAFHDKRYDDNLVACIKAEVRADKFRRAVLLALSENRESEDARIKSDDVEDDILTLAQCLGLESPDFGRPSGGESEMLQTLVCRSDQHLAEILRLFRRTYHVSLTRAILERSGNLVGETLAHLLNGSLNRALRDAQLLHQSLHERPWRTELLVSRVVRFHWEPRHLARVRTEYLERYNVSLQQDIYDMLDDDIFARFISELCKERE